MSHISEHEEVVQAQWIDYNGHMNVAFYVLVFDHATDTLFDQLGLDQAYRDRENKSVFVIESHVTYEHEVVLGDVLFIKSWLLGVDEKRLHVFHEMYHKNTHVKCSTNEIMALHVDTNMRKTAPIRDEDLVEFKKLMATSLKKGRPDGAGRSIRELAMGAKKDDF